MEHKDTKFSIIVILLILHFTYLSRLFAGFLPTREVAVHQGMETGVVTGFQQVTEFVNDYMLDTPLWQQQQIGRETDAAVFDIADAPARNHRLVID